jgi:hypothetical protein
LKFLFNIVLQFTHRFSKSSLSFRLRHHNPVYTCPFAPSVLHAPRILLFLIWSLQRYLVKIMKLLIMQAHLWNTEANNTWKYTST